MNIRGKMILIVLPLIIAPLVVTGIASTLAARNGITGIATEFLRFKAEQLTNYAVGQFNLLQEAGLGNDAEFIDASKSAVASFARGLVRSATEVIVALDDQGVVVMSTDPSVEALATEQAALAELAQAAEQGWQSVRFGGQDRVAQSASFGPFGWYLLVSERRDTFYESINRILVQTGVILGGATALAIILLFIFTNLLTNPLRRVVGAMRDIITSSDLSQRVEVEFRDETGQLGHTFNLMTGELDKAQQQIKSYALGQVMAKRREAKIRNIFQKYVPKDVIDQFERAPESMLVGEDRILAILFSDIRSFTTISESMRPDEMVESLNHYFEAMVDIITARNGIVDKYIGDAIMAFYGAPVRHKNDAEQAVRSGLEMIAALDDFNVWQRQKKRQEFHIGVGINYGAVTVGNIGSEKKMDYTVIGDSVNLASRLEGLTKKYQQSLVVSESVRHYVSDTVPCRLLDRVIVKGKSTATGLYAPKSSLAGDEEQAWEMHDRACEAFYGGEFDKARKFFETVQQLLPGDVVSEGYLTRTKELIANPPGPDWDGATLMTEK